MYYIVENKYVEMRSDEMKNKTIKFLVLILFVFLLVLPGVVFADEELIIDSPSAILIDEASGKVLYEKNADERMYPASLTKMLTAIVVLENCDDLNEVATVSNNAVMGVSYGYVTANLQVGEELTVEQLLNVLLIGSSNDAAIVLAEHISDSVEDFVALMNQKAKEIGCTNSNFVNTNGTHDENHYSTARDLVLIAKYAMQNETFREICKKTSYKLPATNKYPNDDRLFTTTNELLIVNNNERQDNYYYKYATGIKTGFTTPAGNCLAAAAEKDDLKLITVILGATNNKEGFSNRYLETIKMFKYGFNNYALKNVINSGDIAQTVNVKHATRKTKKLDVVAEESINALVKSEDINTAITPEITINENLKAPINKGDIVGKATYKSQGITYETNLLAKDDVKKSNDVLHVFEIFLVLFVLYLLIQYRKKVIRNKKRNRYIKRAK